MKKYRICIFFHRFDSGGAERMTIHLANALAEEGHLVTLLMRYGYGPLKELVSDKVTIEDMKLPERGKVRKNLLNIVKLRQVMRSDKYDVLLAVTAEMSQIASVAAFFTEKRMPLISIVHSTLSQEVHSFQKIREWGFPFFNKQYDRVIAVSEMVRRDYCRLCRAKPEQTVTIYNPVIDAQFEQRAREQISHPWLIPGRPFVTLVQAGRLCEAKNHRLMLRALELLNCKGDFRLILLGEGELMEELRAETERRKLVERVDFVGYTDNSLPYLRQADIIVLSSRFEGLPTVVIEALALGKKLVCTDCPSGIREILNDEGLGILVQNNEPSALAKGICRAVGWKPDKMALQRRGMDFTVQKSMESYLAVIHEVCEKRKRTDV